MALRSVLYSICCCLLSSTFSFGQDRVVETSAFLEMYYHAIPKLEEALYRNKEIHAEIHRYIRENGNAKKLTDKIEYRSNHDRFLRIVHQYDGKTIFHIFRPDHIYFGSLEDDGSYKLTTSRVIPESASEAYVQQRWYEFPGCDRYSGLGHGYLNKEADFYTHYIKGNITIDQVVLTTDDGKPVFRIDGRIKTITRLKAVENYFDASSFFCYKIVHIFDKDFPGQTYASRTETVQYSMKPDDYSSLQIHGYKNILKTIKGDTILEEEQTFPVYRSTTHSLDTFRLEQFGLPDLAERTPIRSKAFITLIISAAVIASAIGLASLRSRKRKNVLANAKV